MELHDIIYRKSPPLAFISLNRPETRNVFTYLMMENRFRALKDAKNDNDMKVIILSGEGEAFSAGGNIKEMAEGKLAAWDMKSYLRDHVQRIAMVIEDVDKPIVASVDGPAFGGGRQARWE